MSIKSPPPPTVPVSLTCPVADCDQHLQYQCLQSIDTLRQCPCARYWLQICWDVKIGTYYCRVYKPIEK